MRRFVSVVGAAALVALGQGFAPAEAAPDHPDAEVAGVAAAFGLTADQARTQLDAQVRAHRLAATLPEGAGRWFDAATGKLTVAVTTSEAADRVRAAGAAEAMVGDRVCHSGNTSHWQCGEVKYTHKSVDYGGGLVIDDLTWTTACSLGGDSGGGWLLGDKAAGLHDGGPSQCVQNPSDGDLSLFQPVIEALNKWQLALVTGTGDTGGRTLTNDTDYAIRDYQQAFSPIGSTLTGSAAAMIGVSLTIRHTCAEDLGITLLDPKGKAYVLKYSGGSACTPWSAARTFTVPAAASPAAGKWQLRVTDHGPGDTGTLDTWSITL